jgi:nucleoid DNA-binding protein
MSDDNSPVEEKKKGRGRPSATKKEVAVEEKKVVVF